MDDKFTRWRSLRKTPAVSSKGPAFLCLVEDAEVDQEDEESVDQDSSSSDSSSEFDKKKNRAKPKDRLLYWDLPFEICL